MGVRHTYTAREPKQKRLISPDPRLYALGRLTCRQVISQLPLISLDRLDPSSHIAFTDLLMAAFSLNSVHHQGIEACSRKVTCLNALDGPREPARRAS